MLGGVFQPPSTENGRSDNPISSTRICRCALHHSRARVNSKLSLPSWTDFGEFWRGFPRGLAEFFFGLATPGQPVRGSGFAENSPGRGIPSAICPDAIPIFRKPTGLACRGLGFGFRGSRGQGFEFWVSENLPWVQGSRNLVKIVNRPQGTTILIVASDQFQMSPPSRTGFWRFWHRCAWGLADAFPGWKPYRASRFIRNITAGRQFAPGRWGAHSRKLSTLLSMILRAGVLGRLYPASPCPPRTSCLHHPIRRRNSRDGLTLWGPITIKAPSAPSHCGSLPCEWIPGSWQPAVPLPLATQAPPSL